MSMSNRFETETLARQRQVRLEQALRRSAQLGDARPRREKPAAKINFRAGMIMMTTAGATLLLAFGLSALMTFAFAIVR